MITKLYYLKTTYPLPRYASPSQLLHCPKWHDLLGHDERMLEPSPSTSLQRPNVPTVVHGTHVLWDGRVGRNGCMGSQVKAIAKKTAKTTAKRMLSNYVGSKAQEQPDYKGV